VMIWSFYTVTQMLAPTGRETFDPEMGEMNEYPSIARSRGCTPQGRRN
jgi:hypothetical protein